MRRRFAPSRRHQILAGLLAVAVAAWLGCEGEPAMDTPDAALRGFFSALAEQDAEGALEYVTARARPDAAPAVRALLAAGRVTLQRIDTHSEDGEAAVVTIAYTLLLRDGTSRDVTGRVRVQRSADGKWRLASPEGLGVAPMQAGTTDG